MATKQTYQRRSDADRIAELNTKIQGIQERAAKRAARADPVQQHARSALREIEKSIQAGPNEAILSTLQSASTAIRAALDGTAPTPVESKPRRGSKAT